MEKQFFFRISPGKPACLICNEPIAVNKEYNIKRHYESKHKMFLTSYLTQTFNNHTTSTVSLT